VRLHHFDVVEGNSSPDTSGNEHHALISGPVASGDGIFQSGICTAAEGTVIKSVGLDLWKTCGTVEMWLKPDGNSGQQTIFEMLGEGGDELKVYSQEIEDQGTSSHRLRIDCRRMSDPRPYNNAVSCVQGRLLINKPFLTSGRWVHLAIVWHTVSIDQNWRVQVFADGDLVYHSANMPPQLDFSNAVMYIGSDEAAKNGFQGCIDEVRVSNCIRYGALQFTGELFELSGDNAIAVPLQGEITTPSPFGQEGGLQRIDTETHVGIANGGIGLSFRKCDASFALWRDGEKLSVNDRYKEPLWRLHLSPARSGMKISATGEHARSVAYAVERQDDRCILQVAYQGVRVYTYTADVTVSATVKANEPFVFWNVTINNRSVDCSLWDIEFPRILVKALGDDLAKNKFVAPYRRGALYDFGRSWDRPYPGSSVRWQFLALYSEETDNGFYYATEEDQGYTKDFVYEGKVEHRYATLFIRHAIADRIVAGNHYAMTYEVKTGWFSGDWYDAALIYRKWFVTSRYAAGGLYYRRPDIPESLKRAALFCRMNMDRPGRTVERNVNGAQRLADFAKGRPVWGTIYKWQDGYTFLNDDDGFSARPKKGLKEGIAALKERNVFFNAYIQSIIFDNRSDLATAETLAEARKWASKRLDGECNIYATYIPLWHMCRYTEWWQQRVADTVLHVMDTVGAQGVYLDSFGKRQHAECFDPSHGHELGGGNHDLVGQRRLATLVRKVMKAENPQAVMAGEACVEAFVDLLDYYLYAVNFHDRYIPLQRVIFGDFMIGHARIIYPTKRESTIPELAHLFAEGTIIGRFFSINETHLFEQEDCPDVKQMLEKIVDYTEVGSDYVRLGQYLRPLPLEGVPMITWKASAAKGQRATMPAIAASVTRSHRDGSVAVVLANASEEAVQGRFIFDPARYGLAQRMLVQRMDRNGRKTKVGTRNGAWQEPISLEKGEIRFLIVHADRRQ
jgi:hypothetical protein